MKKVSFIAALEVDAASTNKKPGANAEPVKFRIVVNTGARMNFGDEDVALDLQGVVAKNANGMFPVFMGHDWTQPVGHASNLRIEDGALVADGVVSRETPFARDFVESSRRGFPWQASVGGYIEDSIELKEGDELEVNGKQEKGPCVVATKFTLLEASVVEYGADPDTSSEVIKAKGNNMNNHENGVEAARRKYVEEAERVAEIQRRAASTASGPDGAALVAKAIAEGWSPDKFELEAFRASMSGAPQIHQPDEKVDAKALEIAFVRAAGLPVDERKYGDAQLSAADKMRGADFRDVVEECCGYQPTADARKDPREWIQGAFSTANLGSVLSTNADAILYQAFSYVDQSWRKVFKVGSVNSFKAAERWRLDSDAAFKETPATGEFEDAEFGDEKFEVKAKTYGRKYSLSYQSIVNGDALDVFGDIMKRIAFGAGEAINNECWSLFMNPGNCSDSKAFYHADHGSLKASCALSLDNLGAARAAFFSRSRGKVASGSPLGIPPTLLVVPTSLEDKALMLTKATMLNNGASADNPADFNPNFNRFQVVGVPFLEYASFSGYSSTSWYLLAAPEQLAAFEVAFLFGTDYPTVRQGDVEIGKLGVIFDGQLHFGVSRQDYRGALKCTA